MNTSVKNKQCPVCQNGFLAENNAQLYCSRSCRNRKANQNRTQSAGHWTQIPRACPICEKTFLRPADSSPNKKHCSPECALKAIQISTHWFKNHNPTAMHEYNKRRYAKYGRDSLITRLRKRYPDLPTRCEVPGCEEGRVLDLAHKPEHKRNGAHRVLKHYERHMFWILCPTHHALHDRGVLTAAELELA